ncbi:TPA: hypothetical protein ON424_002439 [Morganella morganii]|nr:hypothetical protein [Morganella morganii]
MAKTPTERKAAQRKRQQASGMNKFGLQLDATELDMLKQNCVLRRPGREPYDMNEYIQLLIIKDNRELQQLLAKLSQQCCGKCGDALPVTECCFSGDAECWNAKGWHELKLEVE